MNNTAVGYRAGYVLSTGTNNNLFGVGSGDAITTGSQNVAIGNNALGALTTTSGNIAVGYQALDAGVDGVQNCIGIGSDALGALTASGSGTTPNIAIGFSAGSAMTTGTNNIAIGSWSMNGVVTGVSNVAVGHSALTAVTSGGSNTAIGQSAGDALVDGSNNIIIGKDADAAATNTSNSVTLGNGSISALRCQVQSISALSDRRDKKEIKDLDIGLDFINTLHPVKFTWNMRDGGKVGIKEAGFIAQELDESQNKFDAEEYLQLVLKDNPEKLEAAMGKLMPSVVKAVQELSAQVDKLKDEIKTLTGK
jgi:hypothetical protein